MPSIEERGYVHCAVHDIYYRTATPSSKCPICDNLTLLAKASKSIKRLQSKNRKANKDVREALSEVDKYRKDVKADTEDKEGSI